MKTSIIGSQVKTLNSLLNEGGLAQLNYQFIFIDVIWDCIIQRAKGVSWQEVCSVILAVKELIHKFETRKKKTNLQMVSGAGNGFAP